jgi:ferredoxin
MIGSGEYLGIAIDRIACDGFGMCAELLPELVELDDWGYPIVAPGAVPGDLLDHARRAAAVCPVLAFRLRPVPAPASAAVAPGSRRQDPRRPTPGRSPRPR